MATLTTGAGWAGFAAGLADLRAALPVEDSFDGTDFVPSTDPPPARILAAATELGHTPAIVWDLAGLRTRVAALRRLVHGHGLGLSAAVKACRTVAILGELAAAGLTADVASPAELAIARRAGFRRISATGPGFRARDIAELYGAGVLFDAQSPVQLAQAVEAGATRIGLRLRVPLPEALRSTTSRGADSRFGVVLTPDLVPLLRSVARLRVHTGESTARTLEFRTRFAVLVAGLIGTVDELNLGGGLLRLARQPSTLDSALGTIAHVARGLTSWVEPGAALVLDSAYLVTEVLDVHTDAHAPAVTVDASAWNIAPWAYPSFYTTGSDRYRGTIFGPTLYEKDRFRGGTTDGGARPTVGDRLVGTSFGAYTLANGRRFAGLALPRQYAVTDNELEAIDE